MLTDLFLCLTVCVVLCCFCLLVLKSKGGNSMFKEGIEEDKDEKEVLIIFACATPLSKSGRAALF